MKIFLIRHGQTTGDIEDRYGGDYDDHLTKEGRRQSEILAEKLFQEGIQKIVSSPKIRAQETAKILSGKLKVPFETLPDFRERNQYGILTGLTKAEARARYPDQVELLRDTHNTITGGEEYRDFKARIIAAINSVAEGPEKTVAVVTHGGPIRVIFREMLKKGEIDIKDCAFAELEYEAGNFSLDGLEGISVNA